MKAKWIGLTAVLLVAGAIIGYKAHVAAEPQASGSSGLPRVLLECDRTAASHD
jgi:hypothetical protein